MFYGRRRPLHPKKPQNPRVVLLKQILIGLILTALFVGLGYGVWYGSRLDTLSIKEVKVTGGETVSNLAVQKIVERELEGEYFKLVPKRFAWTYPEEKIFLVIKKIPRVHEVKLEVVDGETLEIAFNEYHPYALWCDTVTPDNCVFIDENGYAFDEAPSLIGGAFLRYSDKNQSPAVGESAFSADFIKDSASLNGYLNDKWQFETYMVERQNEDESDYHLSGGGVLKVSARLSVEETLENLEAILASEEFSHLRPGNFRYIDLRYGNKVFVNEEAVEATEEIENENAADSGSAASDASGD